MASIFRLTSSSDLYLNANYFDSKDNNIYVHRLGKERCTWEYTAAIGQTGQPFKELEVSSGVVIRGEKLAELVTDLRPAITTNHDTSPTTSSFYSLRVNHEGRCYVRSEIVGDSCLHGSKLNAFFDWSKYGVVTTKALSSESENKWKEIAEERARELEVCKLKEFDHGHNMEEKKKKKSEEEDDKKELAGEDDQWELASSSSFKGTAGWIRRRPGWMDYSAVLVVVFYVVGLYYWGAKLLAILFRKKT